MMKTVMIITLYCDNDDDDDDDDYQDLLKRYSRPTLTVGYNRCPSKPDGRSRIVMTIVTIWPSLTIISMMTSFLKFLFHWLSALLAQVLIGHTIGFRQF